MRETFNKDSMEALTELLEKHQKIVATSSKSITKDDTLYKGRAFVWNRIVVEYMDLFQDSFESGKMALMVLCEHLGINQIHKTTPFEAIRTSMRHFCSKTGYPYKIIKRNADPLGMEMGISARPQTRTVSYQTPTGASHIVDSSMNSLEDSKEEQQVKEKNRTEELAYSINAFTADSSNFSPSIQLSSSVSYSPQGDTTRINSITQENLRTLDLNNPVTPISSFSVGSQSPNVRTQVQNPLFQKFDKLNDLMKRQVTIQMKVEQWVKEEKRVRDSIKVEQALISQAMFNSMSCLFEKNNQTTACTCQCSQHHVSH